MGRRRTWTMAELQDARVRSARGETWAQIAEDFDVTASTVRKQVRTHLGSVEGRVRRPYRVGYEDLLLQALKLRNVERFSWSIISDLIGWTSSSQALIKATQRYATETGSELYKGFPERRRSRWDNRDKS